MFANWIRKIIFEKSKHNANPLFSDEKMFDLNGMYNSQNDILCPVNHAEADIKQIEKFPEKVMVWFGVCAQKL